MSDMAYAVPDGLTDEQYEALVLAETTAPTIPPLPAVSLYQCRLCKRLTENACGGCDSCLDDARSEHESQRTS